MKYLPLRNSTFTIIDDEDYEIYSQWEWSLISKRYAGRWDKLTKTNVYLHRLINNTSDGFDTDHINRDKLDNRRSNLRSVTRSQNMSNCVQKNNTSGYRGVSWHKQRRKWAARAKIDGIYKSLGLFETPLEASKVYESAVADRFI